MITKRFFPVYGTCISKGINLSLATVYMTCFLVATEQPWYSKPLRFAAWSWLTMLPLGCYDLLTRERICPFFYGVEDTEPLTLFSGMLVEPD
jgi:hypothetical protein